MTDPTPATPARKFPLLAIIGPGVLVAATGVGAGDIATASIAGSMLGVAILWAAGFGATLKFVLTECLARWQIATQRTILEGAMLHLGWFAFIAFVIYLVPWTFVTCAALINACGVFAGAMIPYNVSGLEPNIEKIIFGIASSLVGLILVWFGGYKLFARVMTVAVGIMFACVITTAIMLKPDPVSIVSGLLPISLPQWDTGGLTRTIAYMGGVGGTLTIICYSYWMRESGRTTKAHLRIARIDALIAYTLSALFGIAVVIIASKAQGSGSGSALITSMGDVLEQSIGPTGKYIFLGGAFAAAFSSVLGVWQSVPYIYADVWRLRNHVGKGESAGELPPVDTKSRVYKATLLLIATVPMLGVLFKFNDIQLIYAFIGAFFIPGLALACLILTSRKSLIGGRYTSSILTKCVLVLAIVFFTVAGTLEVKNKLGKRSKQAETPAQSPAN